MALTAAQKAAIEEILNILMSAATLSKGKKRQLCHIFMNLVDRTEYPAYYEIIPEPRAINGICASVEKNRYKDALDAYTDLSLVFWNALFYNESDSQIAADAATLKDILESEWKKRPILPAPRHSPPPSSPQKVHGSLVVPQPSKARTDTTVPITANKTNMDATTSKPVSRPKSPVRPSSPEMEVDVSGLSPEPDGQAEDIVMTSGGGMERDAESEDIVRQLERGLPKWQGFGDHGWMSEVSKARILDIVHVIKSHKDVVGNRLATALEAVPEDPTNTTLSSSQPLSLKLIEGKVRSEMYASSKDFDMDMARLFEKARRWHEPCTEPYGAALLLQRLYQALTSSLPPPGPPYTSTTNFASLRAGPGTARPLHTTDTEGVPGVTTFRVSVKDRIFVDEVHYKGYTMRLADWLHLSNPDDPSRPIIGQIFKCWVSDEVSKKGQPGLTVCWYYRPEQTFHPAHRQFWEGEVFKTSHFADHPLEDVIEKIACQFTARHIRGRPRPPFWYPGWPLYVCDSRYNDRDRAFVKIKNWNSCVPEEVRKSTEFMPIYPFERVVFPRRFDSPFLAKGGKAALKGPGGIGESVSKPEVEKAEGGVSGRRRPRRAAGGASTTDHAGPNKGLYVGVPGAQGSTVTIPPYQYQPLQQPPHPTTLHRSHGNTEDHRDRSLVTAAGGLPALGNAVVEKLPPETSKHFDRSPDTNEVLWFAAPPINVPRTPAPKYSLSYLHFLARQKKNIYEDERAMSVDDEISQPIPKRQRTIAPTTVTETLRSVLADMQGPST